MKERNKRQKMRKPGKNQSFYKKKSGIGSKIAGHADADYQKNNGYTHQYHDRFLLSI